MYDLIINNIAIPIDASYEEAFSVARKRLARLGIEAADTTFSVYRKSVDARKRSDIKFVYSVSAHGSFPSLSEDFLKKNSLAKNEYRDPEIAYGEGTPDGNIVVVGSGPCGLFTSLLLAECGFKPVLIERGGSITERRSAVAEFELKRYLDRNTNIQFGAGGAGTFSDGKLVTRINDSLTSYVLKTLVRFGAPEEILYAARPHIGTDILSSVVDKILLHIESLGGRVLYNTQLLDFTESAGRVKTVITNRGELCCADLVLAVGHSARDTYSMLIGKGLSIEAKAFSVGMRIEHRAELIDKAMYGDYAGHPSLGHAEYNLSYNTKLRGVYTFCMCPGGVVVAATSEEGGVVTNGMSYHSRAGNNSNSAVLCSIFKEDYGNSPERAIEFQRRIEHAAFVAGGSDYSAPIITVGDFLSDRCSQLPTDVLPTYMNGVGVRLASPDKYLPRFVIDNLKAGLSSFENRISGFTAASAVLTGAETRTSAPIRILRDNRTGQALSYTNLYPAGEGAGYAGGITSAAIDGIKTALCIMKKYKPRTGEPVL